MGVLLLEDPSRGLACRVLELLQPRPSPPPLPTGTLVGGGGEDGRCPSPARQGQQCPEKFVEENTQEHPGSDYCSLPMNPLHWHCPQRGGAGDTVAGLQTSSGHFFKVTGLGTGPMNTLQRTALESRELCRLS